MIRLLESRKYDAVEMLDTVEREKVNGLVIVGDPLGPAPRRLGRISGAMGLELARHDDLVGRDVERADQAAPARPYPHDTPGRRFQFLGGPRDGVSVSGGGAAAETASFSLGPDVKVLTEDGREVEPGSDEVGVLALGGRNPLGYYKDDDKSERTFKTIEGVRYSIPGDFAQVGSDGTAPPAGPDRFINFGGREDLPRGGRGGGL